MDRLFRQACNQKATMQLAPLFLIAITLLEHKPRRRETRVAGDGLPHEPARFRRSIKGDKRRPPIESRTVGLEDEFGEGIERILVAFERVQRDAALLDTPDRKQRV